MINLVQRFLNWIKRIFWDNPTKPTTLKEHMKGNSMNRNKRQSGILLNRSDRRFFNRLFAPAIRAGEFWEGDLPEVGQRVHPVLYARFNALKNARISLFKKRLVAQEFIFKGTISDKRVTL